VLPTLRIRWLLLLGTALGLQPEPPAASVSFPLEPVIRDVRHHLRQGSFRPIGLSRDDYLSLVDGIVEFFQHFQAADGRIIDPFARKEVQYSTPCYAWAAAALVAGRHETGRLESAAQALDAALQELAEGRAADGHGDFFTFPAVLAFEHLRERVPAARRQRWEERLGAIRPEQAYRDVLSDGHTNVHNWNVVAVAGEFFRHQAGFTDTGFVERHLAAQMPCFTSLGLYRDPHEPMAYDHFPRHFLAAMLQRGYAGAHRAALEELLGRAAWTSLLMQSPAGELPTGGRSAQHQWNEAQQCVTYEIWAARQQAGGDAAAAQAFKRAAHLALQSVRRWVRPSGELWIVKNHFDPAVRHGFEGYSFHSQYNLLAASMLATAWLFADDTVAEGPCPADVGSYAIEVPEFHKVFANAGGLYLEVETAADPQYNSTGLIRVHRSGVDPLVGPSDGSAGSVGPLAVGVAWREGDRWQALAGLGADVIQRTTFAAAEAGPDRVKFTVRYHLGRPAVQAVEETYDLTPTQVRVTVVVDGEVSPLRMCFPALVFDGERAGRLALDGATATVQLGASRQVFRVESPPGAMLRRSGAWTPCRNGYLEAVEAEVSGPRVVYSLAPEALRTPKAAL
jgi:hypothetical protein